VLERGRPGRSSIARAKDMILPGLPAPGVSIFFFPFSGNFSAAFLSPYMKARA
jgi:hypothetical protein